MMRICLLVILWPCLLNAQHFSAADLKLLKTWSTGTFSTEGQVLTGIHFAKADFQIQPIWQKRKDGVWLFVKQTDSVEQNQVWHYYIQDNTTMILQLLQFKEIEKAKLMVKDINQESKLNIFDLLTRQVCEIYLKKINNGYAGAIRGKDCFKSLKGAEYLSESISVIKNSITRLEMGFDIEDKKSLWVSRWCI